MSILPRWSLLRLAGALLLLIVMTSGAAMAQSLRFVTGSFVDHWSRYDPPGATTTVTTVGGQRCGPNQTAMDPCQGNLYPIVAGQNVAPIRPTEAIHQAGLAVGDPVNMPMRSERTRQTSDTIPSGGLHPRARRRA